ncbi:MAG: O-antigen/teichoic acid export membrane protein [Colwellia sp.]|jgi:O-antigen/teichoic acid export membrane protein
MTNTKDTSGRVLANNVIWNTLGLVLPMFVGVFTIPHLIEGLGTEKFGILATAWLIIGYFSIFDMGLGRALTKFIAELLSVGKNKLIPQVFWTAITLMFLTGVVGGFGFLGLSGYLVFDWLTIQDDLQMEVLHSFYILSLSIPIVVISTGFRGILEAFQKFKCISYIRIPVGLFTFIGPLAVLPFSNSLVWILLVLLANRILSVIAYYIVVLREVPLVRNNIVLDRKYVVPMLKFGGWLTVSNIVGPLIVYLDRFFIGVTLTMTAVSYYVAPYEVVTKLLLIPMGLIGVLFPAFTTMLHKDVSKAVYLYSKGIAVIAYSMFPMILLIMLFSYQGLFTWLGTDFAENGVVVVQWLCVGVFINSIARMPNIMLQSGGRPDLQAKLVLFEFVPYLYLLWMALQEYGIAGAAMVWTLRVMFDTLCLFYLSSRVIPEITAATKSFIVKIASAVTILYVATYVEGVIFKVLYLVFFTFISFFIAWRIEVSKSERKYIKNKLFCYDI